jgi:hypothetical protein
VPLEQLRSRLLDTFARWGKPGAMRVDNGEPLGAPTGQVTPVLALWLIAIDVDMIWNKPRSPQLNGRVEKMQHTTARWAEVHKARDLNQLQEKLDQALLCQRAQYPVQRLQGNTRLGAFPQLETSRRPYKHSDFQIERVYRFLSPKLYTRKVSATGQIRLFGQVFSVGLAYKHQYVQLRLCEDGQHWQALADYKLVKTIPATCLHAQRILHLTVFQ